MLKYILFDLDGTLTDPAVGITSSVNHALKYFGKDVQDISQLNIYIGPPLIPSFQEFHGLSPDEAVAALDYYRERFVTKGIFENEVYEGIPGVLSKLKEDGCTLILATSKPEEFAEKILEHFDLAKYFDFVAGNTFDEARATKEAVLRYIIEVYPDVCGRTAVMVGDRKYDTEGAAACGIDTIGCVFGYGDAEEHAAAGTKYIAESPQDIYRIIKEIV